ncbi:MAG: NADH-quinone oxidoreductase subunit L, partial [Bacteroidota bacterium]|nr:NADH-quinone oxidoreductase subunit L [Bacteroidota bacterium]
FTFSMLSLVVASNIFQIYIFWELVGISSFLLIGFYYDRPSAVAASKKAFIVTRFADLGFLIGILVISFYGGSLDFNTLISNLTTPGSAELGAAVSSSFLGISALTWGMILVFMGAAGKSAMFPLHIWLPDAMEGPTPVSALIHAATMVVAGVYLVARLFPIFAISAPDALKVVAYVGAISAFIAALIACTQTDIKRVLAYSTMSQIGYMMFALGVSQYGGEGGLGYTASMFHLFTHAMFKALLFLGAGSVIHAIHSNEMKDMGGLRKRLPVTHITFLVACLAISGIPPFSGFFSKEEILTAALDHNTFIYWIGLITAGITAFYMFRLYFNIFWSKPAAEVSQAAAHEGHSHGEGGAAMVIPMILLALGAAFAGLIPFGKLVTSDGSALATPFNPLHSIAPVGLGVAGILLAMAFYKKANERPARLAASLGSLYRVTLHKFYVDELYLFVTKKVLFGCIGKPAAWVDRHVVDGAVNLVGRTTQGISSGIRRMQSGKVQQYALYFLSGVILLAILFMYFLK